ncbi:probable protein disulfide-isomerase ER-60 [Cimex lectularius]|uniref:protein disulfide-isomerase n=1 Tax=Cimex lectularius TaxID=79782 RepID=A0A8I6RL09_CIMLE|nr:probable protein disulfide-isomerase ER-60 [Cimex lectularius]
MLLWLIGVSVSVYLGAVFGSNVQTINDENYDEFMKNNGKVFLMYFRKPHSYCSLIRPRFEEAAASGPEDVQFAKIDCSGTGKNTCKSYNVFGNPDFLFFKNGINVGEHREEREKRAFLKFIDEMLLNNVHKFETTDELENYFDDNSDKTTAVGFFDGDAPLKEPFLRVADKLRQRLNFAIVASSQANDSFNSVSLYQPKMFRNSLEPNFVNYEGENNEYALEEWIKENQHGTLRYRRVKNDWQFKDSKPKVMTYFRIDFSNKDKYSLYLRNRILQVAQKFKDHFHFYLSSMAEYPQELLYYGFQEDLKANRPFVTVKFNNRKYVMNDTFSVEKMSGFLEDLLEERLEPFVLSEEVPQASDGLVKQVVGKNIEQVLASENRDVMIMFYAPWCSLSKRMSDKLSLLAEKLIDEDIVVMKMDAVSNDVPYSFDVSDFPTTYWIPKYKKHEKILYKGGSDLNSLLRFIGGHASEELKNYGRTGQPRSKEDL